MKRVLIVLSMLVFAQGCGWETVGLGEAGIKFNKAGSGKGADDVSLQSGWVFHGPSTEVIVFPTSTQTVVWTADVNEGSESNQEITFQAKNGEAFKADVSISFLVTEDHVVDLYKEFRMPDLDQLADQFVRTRLRDAVGRLSVRYAADQLAGPARPELQDAVQKLVTKDLGEHGITVTELSFIGEFRYPNTIKQSLEAATKQIQAAREAQNKVKAVEARARQAVAQAQGVADSKIIAAKADAESRRLQAEGWAKANLIRANGTAEALEAKLRSERAYYNMLNQSVTPRVLGRFQVEKWDGVMPRVVGDSKSQLLLNVGSGK